MKPLSETGCCPRFDPSLWNEKEVIWQEKLFIKDRVRSLFHIPLNFGSVMKRNMAAIHAVGAEDRDVMVLAEENSLWGADVYIAVSKKVPKAAHAKISGTFFSRVFEGPYSRVHAWAKEMKNSMEEKGAHMKKLYFWYTTCPKCAKVYGNNYVVLMAEE